MLKHAFNCPYEFAIFHVSYTCHRLTFASQVPGMSWKCGKEGPAHAAWGWRNRWGRRLYANARYFKAAAAMQRPFLINNPLLLCLKLRHEQGPRVKRPQPRLAPVGPPAARLRHSARVSPRGRAHLGRGNSLRPAQRPPLPGHTHAARRMDAGSARLRRAVPFRPHRRIVPQGQGTTCLTGAMAFRQRRAVVRSSTCAAVS